MEKEFSGLLRVTTRVVFKTTTWKVMVHLSGKTEKPTKEDFKKLNSTEKE